MTKEVKTIDKAIELASNWKIDEALDLISANYELLQKPYFMKNYIKKSELKKYKIKDSSFGYEWNFDQLINAKWWKFSKIDGDTIYISKTGKDLLFDLQDLKSIKDFK